MRKIVYTLLVILLLFQSNAAEDHFVSAAPRLAGPERMKLGTVAVTAASAPAQYGFQKSKGKTGTAADGAGNAARAVLEAGFSSGEGLAAAGSIALTPVAAVVGAIYGGTRKAAPDALAESEVELTGGLIEMAAQSKMREQLLKAAREKVSRALVIREDLSLASDDYPSLHAQGVDAVLETTVQNLRLDRTGSSDASYALFVTVRVRLVRAADGALLYDYPLDYRSGTSQFIDWTLDHANPFKVQAETGYRKLAEKIVERVLLDPASETPRQLDSRTLARNKSQKRPGTPPVLLAANTKQGFGSAQLAGASDWMAGLGTIGIVSTSTLPNFSIQRPLTKGRASRELGERFAAFGGDEETVSAFTVGTLGYGLPMIVAGGLIGHTAGTFAGVPEHRLRMADDALGRAMAESDMQEQLRNQVLRLVKQQSSGRVVLVKKPLPEGAAPDFARLCGVRCGTLAWLPKGQSAQAYLASQGIDTVLEIQILHAGLSGNGGVNPSLALCVEVHASLVRVRDGRELASAAFKYQSKKHKFTEWAANEARLFREEIERCTQTVAEEITAEISGKPLPGTIREGSDLRLAGAR